MTPIRIRLFGILQQVAGAEPISLPATVAQTAGQVLDALVQRFPALKPHLYDRSGDLQPHLLIAVNGRDIRHRGGLTTAVADEDELLIFPPSAGG
ncbi:MAG TPA: ubiquitin-like small modifier protein 1 [Symbiobacteriaceae bacterium]|nr:ubiquitin-like small modifier protein 1 [Symbiobacteriaceae bacterium]